MSEEKQAPKYQVAPGHSFAIPRKERISELTAAKFLSDGDPVPAHWFSEQQLKTFLKEGKVREIGYATMSPEEAERVRTASPGKWRANPADVAGKDLVELHRMILEVDPEMDVSQVTDVGQAVSILCADWNPAFQRVAPPVKDSSKPAPINMHDRMQNTAGDEGGPSSVLEQKDPGGDAVRSRIEELQAKAEEKSPAELKRDAEQAADPEHLGVSQQGKVQESSTDEAKKRLEELQAKLASTDPSGAASEQ